MELELGSLSFSDNESEDSFDDDDTQTICQVCPLSRCDPSHWFYRCMILGLVCISTVALSFNTGLTVGLSTAIIEVMNIDTLRYEYLQGFSTIPDILICAVGGYLINRYLKLRIGLISMTLLGLIGESLFCVGVFFSQYWLMILGLSLIHI